MPSKLPSYHRAVVALVVGGLLLAFLSFFLDAKVQETLSSLNQPWGEIALSIVFPFVGVFVVFVAIPAILLWEYGRHPYAVAILQTFLIASILSSLIKAISSRPRPIPFADELLLSASSFPSSHTLAAFAVLPYLIKAFPHHRWYWIGGAIIVGFSRLYFNVHYLSDVLFGAVIGFTLGVALLHFDIKNKFILNETKRNRA